MNKTIEYSRKPISITLPEEHWIQLMKINKQTNEWMNKSNRKKEAMSSKNQWTK